MREYQLAQQLGDQKLRQQTQQTADAAGQHGQPQHFQREQFDDGSLGCTETAQHRAGIQVSRSEAECDRGHRDAREQYTDQCREAEKLPRLLQRPVEFRAAFIDRQYAFARPQAALERSAIGVDRGVRTRNQHAVVHQRAGADQPGGIKVGAVHQHARCNAEHIARTIRFITQHFPDMKTRLAETDFITDLDIQQLQQTRLDPDITRGRYARGRFIGAERRIANAQHAAQRIGAGDRLDFDQLRTFVTEHDAAKLLRRGDPEIVRARVCDIVRDTRLAGRNHQIRADEFGSLLLQATLDAIGKEADRGDAGHCDDQSDSEDTQLTAAPVAPQHTPRREPQKCKALLMHTVSHVHVRPACPRLDEAGDCTAVTAACRASP